MVYYINCTEYAIQSRTICHAFIGEIIFLMILFRIFLHLQQCSSREPEFYAKFKSYIIVSNKKYKQILTWLLRMVGEFFPCDFAFCLCSSQFFDYLKSCWVNSFRRGPCWDRLLPTFLLLHNHNITDHYSLLQFSKKWQYSRYPQYVVR